MRATELARQIREMRPIELMTINLDLIIEEALREAQREALAEAAQAIAAHSARETPHRAEAPLRAGLDLAQQIVSQQREALQPATVSE